MTSVARPAHCSVPSVPAGRIPTFARFYEVRLSPKNAPPHRPRGAAPRTAPQRGVKNKKKKCTFCSGSDLNYFMAERIQKRHLAYLHPRQVALDGRMGHGDAGRSCASSGEAALKVPSGWLVFTVRGSRCSGAPAGAGLRGTASGALKRGEGKRPSTRAAEPLLGRNGPESSKEK